MNPIVPTCCKVVRSVLVGWRTLDDSFDKKVALDVRVLGDVVNKSSSSGSCGNMCDEGADLLFAEMFENKFYIKFFLCLQGEHRYQFKFVETSIK